MPALRTFLAQRHLAFLLCAATLLLRLLIPTGYMIEQDRGRISITLCSGTAARAPTMAMAGMVGDMADHGQSRDHGKAEAPCAFASLSSASLAAVDPIQLAGSIAYATGLGLAGLALPPPMRRVHLRPPLRGPPVRL